LPVKLKYGSNARNTTQHHDLGYRLLRGFLIFVLGCAVVFTAIFGYL
jgi:hypothetical protein